MGLFSKMLLVIYLIIASKPTFGPEDDHSYLS